MRRLITYFNALFLGVILGMIFVAIIHAPSSRPQMQSRASRITLGYEVVGAKRETTVLLIAGTTTHLVHLPSDFCTFLVKQGCHDSSPVIVESASLVSHARRHQACDLRK